MKKHILEPNQALFFFELWKSHNNLIRLKINFQTASIAYFRRFHVRNITRLELCDFLSAYKNVSKDKKGGSYDQKSDIIRT